MKTLKPTTDVYTIRVLKPSDPVDEKLVAYFRQVGSEEAALYDEMFIWQNFDIGNYIQFGRLAVCFRNKQPVGVLLSRLSPSIFDRTKKLLIQDLFYTTPGTRAAKLLLDDFIDFGKANANYIITMIAEKTNIKERSLERLGFKRSEVSFWMDVRGHDG